MISVFCREWKAQRGGDYRVIGGRDGKHLSELLKAIPSLTVAEWSVRVRYALSEEWFRRNGTIAVLCARWSNYLPPTPRSGQPSLSVSRVAVGIDPATGAVRYREGT